MSVLSLGGSMRRREFITLLSGAASWPLAARAQQPAMRVIGILSAETPASPYVEALRVGLQQLGYVDGRNVRYEYRWAEGNFERLPDLAVELVGLNVDVISAICRRRGPHSLRARQLRNKQTYRSVRGQNP
jgi:putative tryptophan/tyrosine transport system substrate-binding protein